MLPKLLLIACFIPLCSFAQSNHVQNALVTDRPDFTESGVVVPKGVVQIEGGLTWAQHDENNPISGPEMLVRYGLARRFELRVGLPDYIDVENSSGFGDSSLGAKLQLGPLKSEWDIAGILTMSLPTGEEAFTRDAIDPELILTVGRELNARWSLGSQVMVGSVSEGNKRRLEWGATIVLGTRMGEGLGTFIEVAVTVPEGGTVPIILHHGYTYLLGRSLQIDIHGGLGLTKPAAELLVGSGLSVRF